MLPVRDCADTEGVGGDDGGSGILPPVSEDELLLLCPFRCTLIFNWCLLKDILNDIRRVAILLLLSGRGALERRGGVC